MYRYKCTLVEDYVMGMYLLRYIMRLQYKHVNFTRLAC
jgi:hypothetical protein